MIKKRKFKFAPLSGAYMATSMLGILISLMYIYEKTPDWVFDITKPDMRFTWGILFTMFFGIMFW